VKSCQHFLRDPFRVVRVLRGFTPAQLNGEIKTVDLSEPSEPDPQHQRDTTEPQVSRNRAGSLEPSRTWYVVPPSGGSGCSAGSAFSVSSAANTAFLPDFPHFPDNFWKKISGRARMIQSFASFAIFC
jgi:hypothetical protein